MASVSASVPRRIESPSTAPKPADERDHVAAELRALALYEQLYDAGCQLLAKGLPVLPINGKRPCNRTGNSARGWQRVKCDARRLIRGLQGAVDPRPNWKTKELPLSEPGIGIRMGPGSVIDIEADSKDERRAIKQLFDGIGMPRTVSYRSRRGMHFLFLYDERLARVGRDVFKYVAPDGKTVAIRIGGQRGGAQSVIPPTPGREWPLGRSFDEIEVATLPEPVIERLLAQAEKNGEMPNEADRVRTTDTADCVPSSHQPAPTSPSRRSAAIGYSSTHSLASSPSSFHVLETPYDNLNSTVEAAVRRAVVASVPTCYRKRHECVFALVRRLHAIPELRDIARAWLDSEQGASWLQSVLWEWYARGKSFFRADFEECVADFVEGWEKVRLPHGEKLTTAYQESLGEQLPAEVIKCLGIYDCENNRQLLRLIAVLQRRAGKQSFPLDGRACGKVLGITQQAVSRKLKLFRTRGLLQLTSPGRRGRAAEYEYAAISNAGHVKQSKDSPFGEVTQPESEAA